MLEGYRLNHVSLLFLRLLLRTAGAQSGGEPHSGQFSAQVIPCTETPAANEASSPEEAVLDSHQPPVLPETTQTRNGRAGPEVAEFL